jgi:ribosome-associated translation inhibitor RaiA
MEVLQITFRNMKSSSIVEEWIREEAGKLETFYHQITGCRVAVEVPHRHHVNGSPYHVRIDLTLPGGELVIKREADLSSRVRRGGEEGPRKRLEVETPHKNLRLAINDAFKAAARRVQDYARRQRGDVKLHRPLSRARARRVVGV